MGGIVTQKLGDVESDAARADDCNGIADRPAMQQHVDVAEDFRMIEARDRRHARQDAGRKYDLVEITARQLAGACRVAKYNPHAGELELAAEVTQRLVELFLAWNDLCHVELPADAVGGLEKGHAMPSPARDRRAGEAGGTRADDGDPLRPCHRVIDELRLASRARIHEAGRDFILEHEVEAGLVAGDAGIDLVRPAARRFHDEIRVGEQRARHRNEVGVAVGQDLLRDSQGR